jgi:hypothetical protein
MLDLDDIRAEIAEERRRQRSGKPGRGIQDAQSLQRRTHR